MHLSFLLPLAFCIVMSCSCTRPSPPRPLHVYIVLLNNPPVVHLFHEDKLQEGSGLLQSPSPEEYASYLTGNHDSLLEQTFRQGTYQKLYSYTHLLNGFAALLTDKQADILTHLPEVVLVERDTGVTTQTTRTPAYLGLPNGAWKDEGGVADAGEGILIGIVDTGIDPTHPSFSDKSSKPYPNATKYRGFCEVAEEFPKGSCNKKLVGAQHFAAAAIAEGVFNASIDFASPLDADGHGTHTASTAAGNNNVAVKVNGLHYGFASGMAPRAHIAAYKALYRGFGGFKADVVAAIEKAVKDKVDILSLSIGVNSLPAGIATFFNMFDMAMFSATKAGVFVAHSAGNSGPSPQSIFSFSPWVCSVAASVHDRTYINSIILGTHRTTIRGTGLARGTPGRRKYSLILAQDAMRRNSSTQADAKGCQRASLLNKAAVQGKLLICTYDINFLLGDFTLKRVAHTARQLSAAGVVIVLDKYLDGMFSIPMAPLDIPAIFVSTAKDVEAILNYYNITKSKSRARIYGTKVKYSHEAPIVASFSSRGPASANDRLKIADVLKPNIMAPGKMIWAAWSPHALDSKDFRGQRFALISGTSMAAPHIAGIAALVKQKNPDISPAALQSALMTTAYIADRHGKSLLAEHPSSNISLKLGPATPFDYGAGAVNATAALDPGLIFDAGVEDYVRFLCTIPGAAEIVKNTTGMACEEESSPSPSVLCMGKALAVHRKKVASSLSDKGDAGASPSPPPPAKGKATDLNLPSITIANLTASAYTVVRKVKSIGKDIETYRVKVVEPEGVEVAIKPMEFRIAPQETQEITIFLTPSQAIARPSFGHVILLGSHGHTALVPVSIVSAAVAPMDAVM